MRTAGLQGGHWPTNACLSLGLEFNLQPSTSPITAISRDIQTAHHVDHIPRLNKRIPPSETCLYCPTLRRGTLGSQEPRLNYASFHSMHIGHRLRRGLVPKMELSGSNPQWRRSSVSMGGVGNSMSTSTSREKTC